MSVSASSPPRGGASTRYDRLRADGATPVDAMRRVAPSFDAPPPGPASRDRTRRGSPPTVRITPAPTSMPATVQQRGVAAAGRAR